jgi:putative acetyltransferase
MSCQDADDYFNLVNAIKDEGKYLYYSLRFPKEGTVKYLEAHNASGNPVIGTFGNGMLLGWIDFNIGVFDEVKHIATIGMGVREGFRGTGIGSALMDACIKQARGLGIEKLELEVFSGNTVAIALYRKKGFEQEGLIRRKRKFRGQYDDVLSMGLFI